VLFAAVSGTIKDPDEATGSLQRVSLIAGVTKE
jgi:hypothetical protein